MTRYPEAEWVPWKATDSSGTPAYYAGLNKPQAVVLHVMEGYATTARQWAGQGYSGASWHFTVARSGAVMQHLDFQNGGYHAGIPSSAPQPTWTRWRGPALNVNWYTIGIEHEGFTGSPYPEAQAEASRKLCRWLAGELGIPLNEDYFPPHAAIDIVNRVNDFNSPDLRAEFYAYLTEEESMTDEEKATIEELIQDVKRLERLVAGNGIVVNGTDLFGDDALGYLDKDGASLAKGQGTLQGEMIEVRKALDLP